MAKTEAKEATKAKAKKEVVLHPCECGCGTMVARRFAVGHDTRMRPRKVREIRPCGCGCGADVTSPARYRAGHDAKHKSAMVAAALAGDKAAEQTLADLGWTAFLTKAQDRVAAKAAAKTAKAEAKMIAKAEADKAKKAATKKVTKAA